MFKQGEEVSQAQVTNTAKGKSRVMCFEVSQSPWGSLTRDIDFKIINSQLAVTNHMMRKCSCQHIEIQARIQELFITIC